MNHANKIIKSHAELLEWRDSARALSTNLVVTNGCFDLLHPGHVSYLEAACNLGDFLLVGVNSDTSVRQLKGPNRPINPEQDRAAVVAGLQSVDRVFIFDSPTATDFLLIAQPDIYVKGGDYTLETLNQDERRAVESCGGKIVFIPTVAGKSTTGMLERIKA